MSVKRLGSFQLEEEIGAGGMGVVYRARDEKLGRPVAIKVLPDRLAADPERLARFDREARLLASLNHPNVAVLHGLEQDGDTRFLVMELVAGESLEKRLKNGPMPLARALPMALQVAAALEAAHAQGIVHRDLKPGNVMLTPDGRVKLLDFGLAKMLSGDSGSFRDSGTRATTVSGYLMGTPGYMSPEQASGDPVDRRSDVWAFGCLLFEMLSGRRAFGGESLTQMLTAILSAEPDWSLLPADTPPGIRRLLRRCMAKEPGKRLHEMADARLEIEEALSPPSGATGEFAVAGGARAVADGSGAGRAGPPGATLRASGAPFWLAIAGLLVVVVLAGMAMPLLLDVGGRRAPTGAAALPRRYAIPVPDSLNLAGEYRPTVRISPDGRWLAAVVRTPGWQRRLLIHDTATGAARLVDRPDVLSADFSPDSRELFLQNSTGRWVEELAPGTVRPLRHDDPESAPLAGIWIDDGFLVNTSFGLPLVRLDADGSGLREVAPIDTAAGEIAHLSPRRVPGTDWILITVYSGKTWDGARIDALNLRSGERRRVLDGAVSGQATRDGWLLHVRGTDLLAVRFDAKKLAVSGLVRTVVHHVQFMTATGMASYDVADDGTLVYVTGGAARDEETFVWLDREGRETPTGIPPGAYDEPALSPDGTRVAMTLEGAEYQIAVTRVDGGPINQISSGSDNNGAIWSRDGRLVAWTGDSPDRPVLVRPADGSAPARRLGTLTGYLNSWSADGTFGMATVIDHATGDGDIVTVRFPDGHIEPWATGPERNYFPRLSPDGRWVIYREPEGARERLLVRPLSGPGGPWHVTTPDGGNPVWSLDGRFLYVQTDEATYEYAVSPGAHFEVGTPRLLFRRRFANTLVAAPDGRFLALVPNHVPGPRRVEVIRDWSALLADRRD